MYVINYDYIQSIELEIKLKNVITVVVLIHINVVRKEIKYV